MIPVVESADLAGESTRRLTEKYVSSLLEKNADTIVLGCTHYSFLSPLIRSIAGPQVTIVDTGEAIAREVKRRLHVASLLAIKDKEGTESFFTTGNPIEMQCLMDC